MIHFQTGTISDFVRRHRGLLLPVMAAGLIFVILVPLPPALMDMLLAGNIALSAIILLTCIRVGSPLEFSVFPSVLLGATLLRLALNVATTRLILTAGAGGRTIAQAQYAAGEVVWTFSSFVTLGSLAVGVILFAIIVIIQFIVVTRGASRISEVAARFVLDAMPGKQMAIDADLSAKLVTEAQARSRRRDIAREADFYGAMDGASKFLRGDAVAAVIITLVNILGGLYVGLVQYGWGWGETVNLFTRLTIGEGLAMQIPAFLVSVSAALLVTRSAAKTDLGAEVLAQLVSKPAVLIITAAFLAALTLTSLPSGPLLLLGGGCIGLAILLSRRGGEVEGETPAAPASPPPPVQNLEELITIDSMRIELGYALVRLVDSAQQGDLLERIAALRRQVATELGFVVPPIRIRDDMQLEAHAYVIKVRSAAVARGRLYPRELLAIGSDNVAGKLIGRQTTEPAFGAAAVWISPSQKDRAERMNYTVVDAATALMTHLAEVIRRHAAEMLSRGQVVRLLDALKARCPTLVQEATEKLKLGTIQRMLQNLLRERVSIGDLEAILEAACDFPGEAANADGLTEHVRAALGPSLSQPYCAEDGKLWCMALDSELEETLRSQLEGGNGEPTVAPELALRIAQSLGEHLGQLRRQGRRPVILCSPPVRATLRKLIGPSVPDAAVLGYNEIEAVEVQSIGNIGIKS